MASGSPVVGVMHYVSDVATGPTSAWTKSGRDSVAIGMREGVEIRVVRPNGEI